jgi:hypothetical protein
MAPEKKECLGCYEPIHEQARKCPHCHQIQSKLYTAQYNKWFLVPMLVLLFGFMAYLMNDLRKVGKPNSEVKILAVEKANLYTRTVSGREYVSCSGDIKNTSNLKATYIDLRGDFYNSKGELIDTFSSNANLRIDAHSSSPYRIRVEADKPLPEYSSCKVTILD